jgi:metal-responsive CopG/Arc/MetJ family transcriptional regulator
MKNIGNSLLASSDPMILRPMQHGKAVLQVVPNEPMDTYHLVFSHNNSAVVIASHPNGYSCHCLAERIIKGNAERIKNQAEYIIACGGTSKSLEEILALVSV